MIALHNSVHDFLVVGLGEDPNRGGSQVSHGRQRQHDPGDSVRQCAPPFCSRVKDNSQLTNFVFAYGGAVCGLGDPWSLSAMENIVQGR